MVKIVVVEDEAALRELLIDELEDWGHAAVSAENGRSGFTKIRQVRPDIILADINMPEMNGYEMREKLLVSDPELAKVPFIYISAYSADENVSRGLKLGADHYITKPVDFGALKAWINSLTRTAAA